MLALVIPVAYAFMGAALLLTLWRLMVGPNLPNRIMALDTLYITPLCWSFSGLTRTAPPILKQRC